MSFQTVIDRLEERGLVRGPQGWDGNQPFECPVHDDRSPSASVRETDDGTVLVLCRAGCDTKDILEALDLTWQDLFGDPRVVAEYEYTLADGAPYIKVERWEPGLDGGKKSFKQYRWTDNGTDTEYVWAPGVSELDYRPLYRLPYVLAAGTVWLVEGEKDADRLNHIDGVFATTGLGGAQQWRPEWTEALRGKHVVMIPDEDEAGLKRAERVRQELEGVAASFTVKHVAAGKDISDHLDAGLSLDDLKTFRPGGRFKVYTPENLPPKPEWVYEPFLLSSSLVWFFGPSGHGKSLALDYAVAEMSRRSQFCLYYDWESPALEAERLDAMGANFNHLLLQGMDPENPANFGTDWFRAEVIQQANETRAALIIFNTYTAMYGEVDATDAWGEAVRQVGSIARSIADDTGACVVIVDHQENAEAMHAYGSKLKKAWSDLYLKVTSDQPGLYDGSGSYYFKIESLKQSRRQLQPIKARAVGRVEDRNLRIYWNDPLHPVLVQQPEHAPDAAESAPALAFKERLALMRLKEGLGVSG